MPNYAAFNTNADDLRTLIFGNDGTTSRAVAVDTDGRLLIAIDSGTVTAVEGATITGGTLDSITSISQKSFVEISELGITTGDAFTALAEVDTSVLGTYSFFVYNSGANEADVQVEISANGTNWFVDVTSASPIGSGEVDVLVPKRFLKYTRLSYRSTNAGQSTTLDVYFNAQGT